MIRPLATLLALITLSVTAPLAAQSPTRMSEHACPPSINLSPTRPPCIAPS